ncbi:MAG: Hsp20/alpha crystallin family protein [Lachnospiraceae bacterium]|jgi:HSP20 family molecular chaperone IbpA|nr:Hsp20/alpha crystallin family protein [Lachnospiraceae bacterium]MBQ4303577.1 Hsp20/alpha crystallin family protein [Lachnospiraceae bacterium]MBQ5359556.1 Hsp20/alpha crystallin family protein [Lachnospiraceae bacterium]
MLLPSIFGNDLFDTFDNFLYPVFEVPTTSNVEKKLYGGHAGRIMKTDVREHETGYEIAVDLPGFKKDEIKLELKDGYLTVSAAKGLEENEKDKKTGKYIRRERYSGSMSRSYFVGEDMKQEDIKAKFEDGVLNICLPKKELQQKVEENHFITIE